jgi:hypothetical protein
MATQKGLRSRATVTGVLALVMLSAALTLAACGGSGGAATSPGATAAASGAARAVDYEALLTAEDVRAITGHVDATAMPEPQSRKYAGSSKYFVIYQGKKWDEALWLRVGYKGMFEEERGVSDTPPRKVEGLGDDAFTWDWTDMHRGVAVLVGDTTYIISTSYRWDKPQMTDAQLMEVAKTVVGRL